MDMVSIGVSPGMQAVAAGSLNIMHNSCNAVVSFIEMGGGGTHLSMVSMGIHPGVVVTKKGLASASELKGKVVGTSSIKSGSTILLRRLLKAHGLAPSDYDVVAGQGSAQIFSGLQAGALDAVWLVPPQSLTAVKAGYPVLGTFKEVAPKFPFVCFATNDAWRRSNTAAAQGFAKAWLAAVAWLYDPANRAEAEKLLAEELKLAPDIAAATYDALIVRNADTFPRSGMVDLDVLQAMIDVMVEGEELPARPKGDIRRYLDDTMLAGAK
jgi:ABC-type nitrate/sulfonate/bicarbonate transport system substrate-binding protein